MKIYHLSFSGLHEHFLGGCNIRAKSMVNAILLFQKKYPNYNIEGIIKYDIPSEEFQAPIEINEETETTSSKSE